MKILLFIDQLYLGGAGRVASVLVKILSARGYQVTVIFDKTFGLTYTLPEGVETVQAYITNNNNILDKVCNVIKRLRFIRKQIKRNSPDIIIAFLPHIFLEVKLSSLFLNIPIIASDHTSMQRDLGYFVNFIRHRLYAFAEMVTILTHKDERYLGSRLKNKRVVYNPLPFVPQQHYNTKREKVVLCVGRVCQWNVKGFDRMVEIWSRLSSKYSDWRLEIAGPYDDKSLQQLTELIRYFKVEKTVRFLGQVDDVKSLYNSASIFALPSRVEGFPVALIEAMSQGCACVSFAMQGAVNEIICNDRDGIIVEDGYLDVFAEKVDALISNDYMRSSIAQQAIFSSSRFSEEAFADRWLQIIDEVITK